MQTRSFQGHRSFRNSKQQDQTTGVVKDRRILQFRPPEAPEVGEWGEEKPQIPALTFSRARAGCIRWVGVLGVVDVEAENDVSPAAVSGSDRCDRVIETDAERRCTGDSTLKRIGELIFSFKKHSNFVQIFKFPAKRPRRSPIGQLSEHVTLNDQSEATG